MMMVMEVVVVRRLEKKDEEPKCYGRGKHH